MTTQKLPPYAERLWTNLQSNFIDLHKTLLEIFEAEAWKPAYETFTDAWTDKMGNISFARELLPHIMYQMFDEGATPERVADTVKNVGPDTARDVKAQKDRGVAADKVTVVRRHLRKRPSDFGYLRLRFGLDTLKDWKRLAEMDGTTLQAVALTAVTAAFAEISARHGAR